MKALAAASLLVALGCSSSAPVNPVDAGAGADAATDARAADAATAAEAGDAAGAADAADAGNAVARLLSLTSSCNQVSSGLYALNAGDTPTVPICGLTGALFWKADMDVDCDGKTTAQCSSSTDPDYQDQTAAVDSQGNPLDAANLPYVVVPGKSSRFDFGAAGLVKGSVIAVVYKGQLEFAVYGDVGPSADIGEASYATVKALGANPNPKVGGVDTPDVLYVAFTGPSGVASPIEDHAQAVSVGQARLAELLGP